MAEALTSRYSVLGHRLHAAENPEDKARLIFKGLLSRDPTDAEMAHVRAEVERIGDEAVDGLV